MPYIVKKISGEVLNFFEGECTYLKGITGVVGLEDYIHVNNFIGFTQNFSKVVEVEVLPEIKYYGYKHNFEIIELEISY